MEPVIDADETQLAIRVDDERAPLETALMRMTPAEMDRLDTQFEQMILLRQRLAGKGVLATKSEDWASFGKGDDAKPYLWGKGGDRAAAATGMHLHQPIFAIECIDGEWFVECTLTVDWPIIGISTTHIGSRDTCDKFFAQPGKDRTQYEQFLELAGGRVPVAKRKLVPWLKKSARENAVSRAVSTLLGIRGCTWADLEQYGIVRGQGGTVTFKESSAKASTAKPKPTTTRSAKASAPTMKLNTLETVDIGSVASVLVRITDKKELDPKRTILQVKDDTASLSVTAWTTRDPLPECAEIGFLVQLAALKVGEYNGQRQYSVDATAIKEGPKDATNGLLD